MKWKCLLWLLPTLFVAACAQQKSDNAPQKVTYFAEPFAVAEVIESEKQKYFVDTLITGLEIPWGMAFLPNGDVLITERKGQLRIVKNGVLSEDTILGVPPVVFTVQGGLLDIELHPNYEENGWIYLAYSCASEEGGSNTAIMRAKLEGNTLVQQEKIFQATPFGNRPHHFGCKLQFDREGYLYFSVGDRGEWDNAQDLTNHAGKIHRIHDDGRIPEDNPFLATEGAMPSIFTYGNRNPQGVTIHPQTGEIWAHEHGPRGGDEVNIIKAGTNYGWPVISYGINYDSTIITELTEKEGLAQPLHYWVPSIAPCGMTFTTSDLYPNWKGNLLVGSLRFRYLNRCEVVDGKIVHEEKLLDTQGRVRDVEVGPDGYIYVAVEAPGMLLRVYPINEI
jgi:glucose/arabinose dehydrogenase